MHACMHADRQIDRQTYIHTYTLHTHYIHISADPWRIAFVLSWNTSGRSSAGQRPENHPWPLRYWRGEITGDDWNKICKYVKHGNIFPKVLGKPHLNICSIYIMIYHELCHVHYLGEASGGVHGDNRLAGNSLLECLLAERGGGTMALWFSHALMCSVDKPNMKNKVTSHLAYNCLTMRQFGAYMLHGRISAVQPVFQKCEACICQSHRPILSVKHGKVQWLYPENSAKNMHILVVFGTYPRFVGG